MHKRTRTQQPSKVRPSTNIRFFPSVCPPLPVLRASQWRGRLSSVDLARHSSPRAQELGDPKINHRHRHRLFQYLDCGSLVGCSPNNRPTDVRWTMDGRTSCLSASCRQLLSLLVRRGVFFFSRVQFILCMVSGEAGRYSKQGSISLSAYLSRQSRCSLGTFAFRVFLAYHACTALHCTYLSQVVILVHLAGVRASIDLLRGFAALLHRYLPTPLPNDCQMLPVLVNCML